MTTDPELVTLVAAGDVRAFATLYRRHLPSAQRQARQLAGSRADAEDLVSAAFVNILHAIRHGRRPDQFRAYLLATIRNRAYADSRRRCRHPVVTLNRDPVDIPASDPDPSTIWNEAADPGTLDALRQAFWTLPPRWRAALWLSAVEEHTAADLAIAFNLTPNAMAALTSRARRGLRRAHIQKWTNLGHASWSCGWNA